MDTYVRASLIFAISYYDSFWQFGWEGCVNVLTGHKVIKLHPGKETATSNFIYTTLKHLSICHLQSGFPQCGLDYPPLSSVPCMH